MYTIILDEGIVVRNSDNLIILPCQSPDDQDFIEYNAWVNEGNTPTTYNTRPENFIAIWK